MNYENHILDALMIVLASDVSDEDLSDAVSDRANLLAMVNPDDLWEDHSEIH